MSDTPETPEQEEQEVEEVPEPVKLEVQGVTVTTSATITPADVED